LGITDGTQKTKRKAKRKHGVRVEGKGMLEIAAVGLGGDTRIFWRTWDGPNQEKPFREEKQRKRSERKKNAF